jgi:TetR/AcrR family transcriptional repressor of nem operon
MARPRQYDPDAALRHAYEVFWSNGYEATSVQRLLDSMRLNRGSLYTGFADKHTLFLAALRRYRAEVVQPRLEAMRNAPSAREGLRGFFAALAAQCAEQNGPPGCLATNSAVELAARDPVVAEELVAGMRRIEAAFAQTLRRGVRAGEFPAGLPIRATARYLLGVAQGINVLGKVMRDQAYLNGIAATALRVLK